MPDNALMRFRTGIATVALAAVTLIGTGRSQAQVNGLGKLDHVLVIYQENWSFDGLYGKFPGANGIGQAAASIRQVDRYGNAYTSLPQPVNTLFSPAVPDPRFPADMPLEPFDIASFVNPNDLTGDLIHRFYQEQLQIDGGRMDKFIAWSDAAGLALSYYDATNMPEGKLAQQFTLLDNFFHGAFGGSFLNHQFLICACAPSWPGAPQSLIAELDSDGNLVRDGTVTPDGFAVNTAYPLNTPHPASITESSLLVPEQTAATIGDRLSEGNVSWTWYSGGWNTALLGHPEPLFQFHHQPFAYYASFADDTEARRQHLRDEQDFYKDVDAGRLPAVAFVKPLGPDTEHPGYASLFAGQQHVADLVQTIMDSQYWHDTAIIITYDENGGRWDHVSPPVVDRWGPGVRVPAIIVSPYARKGFVDHAQYDTAAILRLIEERWGLQPLGTRDSSAGDLLTAFDFDQ